MRSWRVAPIAVRNCVALLAGRLVGLITYRNLAEAQLLSARLRTKVRRACVRIRRQGLTCDKSPDTPESIL
jgi:hypothetical protein